MSLDARLLVPLDALPGLDVVGLNVRVQLPEDDAWHPAVRFTSTIYGDRRLPVWVVTIDGDRQTLLVAEPTIQRVRLSFEDPSTRDRAARWLAARKGYRLGSTAPFWGRALMYPFSGQWLLGFPSYLQTLPDGHSLDPGDLTTLEDGSLLVDALALALLCQHVGGTR